jgi:outer membrane protein assembly factor BamB
VLANQGILDCYDLKTGAEIYRERIAHQGAGFSASPVAADGKIYLSSEDGDIFVVKAGPKFELLANNPVGELLMATPAVSSGMLIVRAQHHVFAISR